MPGSRDAHASGLARLEFSVRGMLRNLGLKPGQVSKGSHGKRVRELTADNARLSKAVEAGHAHARECSRQSQLTDR